MRLRTALASIVLGVVACIPGFLLAGRDGR